MDGDGKISFAKLKGLAEFSFADNPMIASFVLKNSVDGSIVGSDQALISILHNAVDSHVSLEIGSHSPDRKKRTST